MDINGKQIADDILADVKAKREKLGIKPRLAFILVGDDTGSKTYVRMKEKRCAEIGFQSEKITLEENTTQSALFNIIDNLNADEDTHGILVQMPLPSQFDEQQVLERVRSEKDVDGFHPYNMGRMICGDRSGTISCTPLAILTLLEMSDVKTEGANVVVVGRSNIVGMPIANLLSQKANPGNATVTIAHSKTPNLNEVCRSADILIVAIGRPRLITKDMVKKGAVVIDVGINRADSGKLVGDVDYESVKEVASKITPVPGGVGPMTIAMLLKNTLDCAKRAQT